MCFLIAGIHAAYVFYHEWEIDQKIQDDAIIKTASKIYQTISQKVYWQMFIPLPIQQFFFLIVTQITASFNVFYRLAYDFFMPMNFIFGLIRARLKTLETVTRPLHQMVSLFCIEFEKKGRLSLILGKRINCNF